MSRFWHALRNLALAMINATLILAALCLWLAWRLASEVNAFRGEVAETVAASLQPIKPLRDEVTALTGQIAALREDLAAAPAQFVGAAEASEALAGLTARATELQAGLDNAIQTGSAIAADPDHAIRLATAAAARSLGDELQLFAGCGRSPGPANTTATEPDAL